MMFEKETVMVVAVRDLPVDIECVHCRRWFNILVNRHDLGDWLSGSLPIKSALSYLSANERELLSSGTCGECFDEMFTPDLDSDE
jgi:hypothetical protein